MEQKEEIEYIEEEKEKFSKLEKKFEKLKEKLKICQKEKEQYLAGWQRERADFINYKKDEEKRFKEMGIFQRGRIILEFLSILDSFEKAEEELKKTSQNKVVESENLSQWIKGILGIKNQIKNLLERENVKEIEAKGKFNPDLHEAVEMVEVENAESGTILEEIQRGYTIQGRLLRPARVKVVK